MVIYKTASEYIGTCQSIDAKIAALEAIQAALLTNALVAVESGHISQYSINDGQVIISTTYRNANEITKSYMAFEQIKNMLINNRQGRRTRLVDSKTFNGNGCH